MEKKDASISATDAAISEDLSNVDYGEIYHFNWIEPLRLRPGLNLVRNTEISSQPSSKEEAELEEMIFIAPLGTEERFILPFRGNSSLMTPYSVTLRPDEPEFRKPSHSKMSMISQSTYWTAPSTCSKQSYHTTSGGDDEGISTIVANQNRLSSDNEYAKILQSKNLWPVDPTIEQDWSGRGQHAEFQESERGILNGILEVHQTIGSSANAVVESVKCKRILLARKTIRCSRNFTKQQATEEVAHLTRLNYHHIVQIIGTYTISNHLSILMYPVADLNLKDFLDQVKNIPTGSNKWTMGVINLGSFQNCIISAVSYIHSHMIKHMDIKPQNILVRRSRPKNARDSLDLLDTMPKYSVYLADFGIARAYASIDDTETEGSTSFTRKYAAPEVVERQARGLSADVFSLGCVLLEIRAVRETGRISPWGRDFSWELKRVLESNEHFDTSYQANIEQLKGWTRDNWMRFEVYMSMLERDPKERPTAGQLTKDWPPLPCCKMGAEPMQAHVDRGMEIKM